MKKITIILHDIMEHLNEIPHHYKYGSLKIIHTMDKEHPTGVITIEYDDIFENHYAIGSVYREDKEHNYESK